MALFWELLGLTGARVHCVDKGHSFAHALKAAYLYFRIVDDAARAAYEIRRSARVHTAFPALRARQERPNTEAPPQYHSPTNSSWNDQGLPPPRWPLGASWIAFVGQPVQGALGRLAVNTRHQDLVEVVARTRQYREEWHRDRVPAPYTQQLQRKRKLKRWLLVDRHGQHLLADLYPTMQTKDIPDLMIRTWLKQGYLNGHPVPPPREAGQAPQTTAEPAAQPSAVAPVKPCLPMP